MTIANIVDRRRRPYRYRRVNAVVEAAWHDNGVVDADESRAGGPDYAELEHASLADAILWAQGFSGEVTLFIYDQDSGIYRVRGHEEAQRRN